MLKKILPLLLYLLIVQSTLAYDLHTGGVYYDLDHVNQTATVTSGSYSGIVTIPDYIITDKGMEYDVIAISDGAFKDCSGVTSITIATGISTIGNNAFRGCTRLTTIKLPNSVCEVGTGVFYGCSGLKSIVFSSNLSTIPDDFFYNCTQLETVTLPRGITYIGKQAFRGCTALSSVSFSTVLSNIDDNAFYGCSNLTSISLPSTVTNLGDYAFYGCSKLSTVILNEGLLRLGSYTFYGCTSLTDISLPSTVENIGTYLFAQDNLLATVTMNCKVTNLSDYTFRYCSQLSSVTLPSTLQTIGNYAFQGCSKLPSLTLPAPLTSVQSSAFNDCSNLKRLTFAEGMVNIPRTYAYYITQISLPSTARNIMSDAFNGCSSLVSVTLPAAMEHIGNNAFNGCSNLCSVSLSNVKTIDQRAFYNCSALPEITLPASLTSIGSDAFADCSNLTELTYAEGTTTALRTYATRLTKVVIPSSCHTFAPNIFSGCNALSNVYVSHLEMWNNIFQGMTSNPFECNHYIYFNNALLSELVADFGAPVASYAFARVKGLRNVTLTATITAVSDYAFVGCTDLQNVVMGNNVRSVGVNAFQGDISLESVRFGSGLTEIKQNAFYGCTALNSVRMGGNEQTIGQGAFESCSNLTGIKLPATMRSLGDDVFRGCVALQTINLPEGITSIPANAFYGCVELRDLAFPSQLATVGQSAFYNCTSFELLTLPDATTTIGQNAFSQCTGLNFVTIGRGITSISSQAFSNCSMLKGFYCLAANAPSAQSNSFDGSEPESITLFVPDESVASYASATPWNSLATTKGLSQAPVYVNSISLDNDVVVISDDPEDGFFISATTLPDNATDKKVTWSSSNTAVVAIAPIKGKYFVQPVSEGVATITCTASDRHGAHATALVIVANRFQCTTSLTLDRASASLTEGEQCHLVATTVPLAPTYNVINWTSSDENIATVSEAGIVTAMKAGHATITATSGDGTNLSATCQLTVTAPANSNLSTRGDSDGNGWVSEADMTAIADYLVGEASLSGNNLDITGDGNITIADIMAVSAAMKDANNVPSGPLVMIKFHAQSYSMVVGDILSVEPQVIPFRSFSHIVWSVDNSSLLRIDHVDGGCCNLVALNPGMARLIATANDDTGLVASVNITIEPNYRGTTDGHQWVDLGLPSGTRWATVNVGAASPESYGGYYAWGEKAEKATYDWTTYTLSNGSSTTLTKYCTASSLGTRDDKTVLEAVDDVAKALWGSNWGMPTSQQLDELFDTRYTTSEWTEQGGVYGRKVTSRTNGYSIFLPAAGYKSELGDNSVTLGGYYESCNLAETSTKFMGLNFGESSVTPSNESFRSNGMSVRPVLCPAMNLTANSIQLTPGETYSLANQISLNNGTSPTLTWSSSNTAVATVSANGEVTAAAVGSATIYATDNAGLTAAIGLTVSAFTLTAEKTILKSGTTTQLIIPTSAAATWSSSDPSIASVSANGLVTAVSDGPVTITCTLNSGASQTIQLYVLDDIPTSLSNTGAAQINLDYVFTQSTRIVTKMAFTYNNGGKIIGELSENDNNDLRFFMSSNSIYFDLGNYRINTSNSGYQQVHEYELGNYYIKRDGSQIASSTAKTFTRTAPLYLFPASYGDMAEVYYVKIYEGNTLVREYFPAYKDGEGFGLYETQQGKYYRADNPQYLTSYTLPSGSQNGHDYVDLGLPSGTLWATQNVGASSVEQYGNYYAWGETQPKSNYSWSTYSLCNNGSLSQLTKYCTSSSYGTVDDRTILELADDAANANWGGEWCMPTQEQLAELVNSNYTTVTWVYVHGVNGTLITSKVNGNSIFMPASGYKSGTGSSYVGSSHYYWSRTLSSQTYAYYGTYSGISTKERYYGYTVRPVLLRPVTSITLPTSLTVGKDNSKSILVSYNPTSSTGKKLLWTSSNESVATVSDEGVVTGVSLGTATITATNEDGSVTATCSVTVVVGQTYEDWTSTNTGHGTTSSHTYSIPYLSGSVLSFDWRVSSESRFDMLIVTLNGTQVLTKSGEDSGTYTQSFTSSGTATLVVEYTKDGSESRGSDKAWITNVKLMY